MTKSLTVLAKVVSNALIFLLKQCECKSYQYFFFFFFFFSKKNINIFTIFQDRNFNAMLANNFVKF